MGNVVQILHWKLFELNELSTWEHEWEIKTSRLAWMGN